MRQYKQPLLLSFLMIILSLSVATNSLNESTENTVLEAIEEPKEVILSLGSLNVPGHQEGSIYTNTTISAGGQHTCAIAGPSAIGNHLYCWGRGNRGQLGTSATQENVPTSTLIPGGDDTVAISSGHEHTCAILDNGDVRCWGRGDRGQLGNGGTSSINSPTLTSSLGTGRTAVAISSGESHTCAILDNGSVSCWGRGNYGQLGDGDILDRNTPTLTSSLGTGRTAIALSSGDTTPALSLTMVPPHVGDAEIMGDWVMGGHLRETHQRSPAALEPVVRLLQFLQEALTPVQSLTMVTSPVGDMEPMANWATGQREQPVRQIHLCSPTVLERVVRQWPFL